MKNTIYILITLFLLASCASSKEKTRVKTEEKTRDALVKVIHDTVTKIDSTYKERYLAVLSNLNKSSDSIVIVKHKDRIVTKKYGNKTELKSIKKERTELQRKVTNLKAKIYRLEQSKSVDKKVDKKTKTKKTTFWKKAALITWGIIVLVLVLGIKYIPRLIV